MGERGSTALEIWRYLETYSQLITSLANGASLEDVAYTAVRLARELLGAEGAGVTREEGAHLVYIATAGLAKPLLGQRTPKVDGFTGRVVRNKRGEIYAPERESATSRVRAAKAGIASGVVAPIIIDGAATGTIGVFSSERDRFGSVDLQVLDSLAQYVAIGVAMRDQRVNAGLAQRAAEDASRSKTALLSRIAGELRPQLEALREEWARLDATGDEWIRRTADRVAVATESLAAVVEDIADLSRIEAGELKTVLTDVEVRGLLEGVIERTRRRARARGVMLRYEIGEAVPVALRSDAQQLEGLLVRLVLEALQRTDGGEVSLEVSRNPPDAPAVLCRVRYRGAPLTSEQRRSLFASAIRDGWGIRAAIADHVATALGGAIGVDGARDGSVFWFTVPLRG